MSDRDLPADASRTPDPERSPWAPPVPRPDAGATAGTSSPAVPAAPNPAWGVVAAAPQAADTADPPVSRGPATGVPGSDDAGDSATPASPPAADARSAHPTPPAWSAYVAPADPAWRTSATAPAAGPTWTGYAGQPGATIPAFSRAPAEPVVTAVPRRRPDVGGSVALVLAAAVFSALLATGGTLFVLGGQRTEATPAAAPSGAAPSAAPANQTAAPVAVRAQDVAAVVAAAANPSVVTITVGSTRGGFGNLSVAGGSGFVVSNDGLVLTAAHIVTGVTAVTVTLPDGRQVAGSVVATDPATDLAVIRVTNASLPALRLGSSAGLAIGQIAIAIGSPLGTFSQSVTEGIVSGLQRDVTLGGRGSRGAGTRLSGLIQTDAAVSSGNAGGPLLDARGQVIGVVITSSSDAQGIGFAVPIDAAQSVIAKAANS